MLILAKTTMECSYRAVAMGQWKFKPPPFSWECLSLKTQPNLNLIVLMQGSFTMPTSMPRARCISTTNSSGDTADAIPPTQRRANSSSQLPTSLTIAYSGMIALGSNIHPPVPYYLTCESMLFTCFHTTSACPPTSRQTSLQP